MLKELLAEFEEGGGIPSSALQDVQLKLTSEEKQLEAALFVYINSLFQDDSPDMTAVEPLFETLKEVVNHQSENQQYAQQIKEALDQYRDVRAKLENIQRSYDSAKAFAELESQAQKFVDNLNQGQLSEAGWCIVSLQKALAEQGVLGKSGKEVSPQLKDLAKRFEQAKLKLLQVLSNGLQHVFVVNMESGTMTAKSRMSGNVPIAELWRGLEVIGKLDEAVKRITDQVSAAVLGKILNEEQKAYSVSWSAAGESSAVLTWSANTCDAEGIQFLERTGPIASLFEFLANQLFGGVASLVQVAGENLYPGIVDALKAKVEGGLKDLETSQALDYLHNAVESSKKLEGSLRDMGFIAEEDARLEEAILSISSGVLRSYPERYLAKARELVANPDWEGVTVGCDLRIDQVWMQRRMSANLEDWEMEDPACGVDLENAVLGRGSFKVSQTAVAILDLMKQVLDDGISAGSVAIFQIMYQTVKDVAVLFSCLPSVLHADQLQVPQIAMMYANDCFYVADNLMLLSVGRSHMSDCKPLGFIHEAMKLREEGRRVMGQQVADQSAALLEVVNRVKAFTGLRSGQEGIAMRRSALQLNQLAARLGRVISDVMTISDRIKLAAFLLEEVTSRIVSGLMSQSDISLQESEELPKILQSVVDELPTSLLSLPLDMLKNTTEFTAVGTSGDSEIDPAMAWIIWRLFAEQCPSLVKLEKLLRIFEARLAHIVDWWEAGDLQRAGFSTKEIRQLIWALFEHSDFREECISRVV